MINSISVIYINQNDKLYNIGVVKTHKPRVLHDTGCPLKKIRDKLSNDA